MVKTMSSGFKMMKWTRTAWAVLSIAALLFVIHHPKLLFGQQPQAPSGTPIYSVNAKYVNGMAPGYWPTAGSGLTLQLSAGTAYCGNHPLPVSYPGGSLALTASTTNYVYLDPANNCSPAASASAFTPGKIPIAVIVTNATSITSITDVRTWFTPQPCATSSAGAVNCAASGTNQNSALTPSGNGATLVTNLTDKGGQVFNVKSYGAKGDGATDDTPAFLAAFNAAVVAGGGIVYVPPTTSCYLFNETLNLTGGASGLAYQVIFQGATGNFPNGSKICGNTGNSPIIDTTAMGGVSFRDLVFDATVSGLSNPSEIGYLSGRSTSGVSGQENKIQDCTFKLPRHTSGSVVSYGIYLYGVEIQYYERDWVQADYPLVVTATNHFGLNSTLDPWGSGSQSETQDSFIDMELESAGLGPAAYFDGTSDMTLTGHSWNLSQSSSYSSSLFQYALDFEGNNSSMSVKWRQEGYPGFLYVNKNLMYSTIEGTTAPGPTPPLHAVEFTDNTSVIGNDVFRIGDGYAAPSSNYFYDATAASPNGVYALDTVTFSCGVEQNCANIPISGYLMDVHYSGSAGNALPAFTTAAFGTLMHFPDSKAQIRYGVGAPSGSCVTPSLFLRTDGGSGSTLYVCENGAWVAK